VKDLPDDHIAHLFYLAQNVVVKAAAPYPNKLDAPIENMIETIVRFEKVSFSHTFLSYSFSQQYRYIFYFIFPLCQQVPFALL